MESRKTQHGSASGAGKPSTPSSQSGASTNAADAPCVMCSDAVKADQVRLECDICNKWCHQVCSKGNYVNFGDSIVAAVEGDDGASICWFCPKCKMHKETIIAAMRDIGTFKLSFESRLSAIEVALKADKPPSVVQTPGGVSQELLQSEISEALERESKKLNLVVVGLPESDKTNQRCDADKVFVKKVAEGLEIGNGTICDVLGVALFVPTVPLATDMPAF